jgi:hypothetical protein
MPSPEKRFVVLLAVLVSLSCRPAAKLPAEVQGEWRPKDDSGYRLRLEQAGDSANVYLVSSGSAFGPLPLKSSGDNAWTFTIATIERKEGNSTTDQQPPSAQRNPQYVIDQQGHQFAPKYVELRPKGEVTIRREGSGLIARGLWMNVETTKFDKDMKALEQKMDPIDTAFELAPAMPPVAEQTTVNGSLPPLESGSWQVTVVRLKGNDSYQMGFSFPSSPVDAQGRFSINIPRAFAEESWAEGFGDFGVALGQGAMKQELLKTGGRAARFKLEASRPAIDLGALSR